MEIGDIVVLKTTGEKVIVIGTNGKSFAVRRPVVMESGLVEHHEEIFAQFELETIDEYSARMVTEMVSKARAQKKLRLLEEQLQREFEAELAETTKAAGPKEVVN